MEEGSETTAVTGSAPMGTQFVAPSSLPPAKRRPGRPRKDGLPPGLAPDSRTNQTKTSQGTTSQTKSEIGNESFARQLPDDAKEQERVLAPYRVLAKPVVGCVVKLTEFITDDIKLRIDDDEKEMGVHAFAALFYQMGGRLDARVLVLLWIVSLVAPRIAYLMMQARKKSAEKQVKEGIAGAKVVQGEATVTKIGV